MQLPDPFFLVNLKYKYIQQVKKALKKRVFYFQLQVCLFVNKVYSMFGSSSLPYRQFRNSADSLSK